MFRALSAAAILAVAAVPGAAQDRGLSLSGQIDLGYRYFFDDGFYDGQQDAGFYPFAGLRLNGGFGIGQGDVVFQFTGLLDDENDRSLLNIEKAYFTQGFDGWDLVLGYNVEEWGVSNGRTIVNVLNAKNRANQVASSELLGTPLANVNIFTDAGTFSMYVLGDNVNGNFGGPATRVRGPYASDDRIVRYEDPGSTDIALRYTHGFSLGDGALDVGLSFYDGTSREAVRMPACVQSDSQVSAAVCDSFTSDVLDNYLAGSSTIQAASDAGLAALTAVTPYYLEMQQVGLTAVYARGDTQFKFEGFHRKTSVGDFSAAIAGVEHAIFNPFGGDGTLTLAAEYHYDNRGPRQPISVYDDDLFFGFDYRANDTNDTQIDFGVFYDREYSSKIFSASASRRIGDRLRVSVRASHTASGSDADALSTVDNDSFVDFTLSTFF